jgi:hypothetical protein
MRRLACALFLLVSPAFAAPNLTGDWKLNLAKSQYGLLPAPLEVTRKIKLEGISLSMSTYQKSSQREGTSELKYTTDGKTCINKMANGESKGTARWDGATLIIDSSQQNGPMEIRSHEAWTLSSDGRTLTILTHLSIPQQGEVDVKQVFEKQ